MPLIVLPYEKRNLFHIDANAIVCFGCIPGVLEMYDYDRILGYGKNLCIFENVSEKRPPEDYYYGKFDVGLFPYEKLKKFPDYDDFQYRYIFCTDIDNPEILNEKVTLFEYLIEIFYCARKLHIQKLVIAFPFLIPQLCDVTQEAAVQELRKILYYFQIEKNYQPDVYFTTLYRCDHGYNPDHGMQRNRKKLKQWISRGCKRLHSTYEELAERSFVPKVMMQNLIEEKEILLDFHNIAAIAIALEFSKTERYDFFHDVGYFYPATKEDFVLESNLDSIELLGAGIEKSLMISFLDLILKKYNPAWGFSEFHEYEKEHWKTFANICLTLIIEGNYDAQTKDDLKTLKNVMKENIRGTKEQQEDLVQARIKSQEAYELSIENQQRIEDNQNMLGELGQQNEMLLEKYNQAVELIEQGQNYQRKLLSMNRELIKKLEEYKLLSCKPEWGRFVEYLKKHRAKGISYSKFAEEINLAKSRISVFVNSKKLVTMEKDTAIAIAVGMGLPQDERVDCIRCAGHSYPVSEKDFRIEKLLQGSIKTVRDLNEALEAIHSDWVLTGTRTLISKKDKEEDAAGISYRL